jgi:hypothetical protein
MIKPPAATVPKKGEKSLSPVKGVKLAAGRKVLHALRLWQDKKHAQLVDTLQNKDDVDPITLEAVRDIPRESLFILVSDTGQKHGYDAQAWVQALVKDARHPSTRERLKPDAIHACVCAASRFAKRNPDDQSSASLTRAVKKLRTPVTLVHIEQRPSRRRRGRFIRAAMHSQQRKVRWMLILHVSPLFVLKSVKVSGKMSEPIIEYDIDDSRSASGAGPLAHSGTWRSRGGGRGAGTGAREGGGLEGGAPSTRRGADASGGAPGGASAGADASGGAPGGASAGADASGGAYGGASAGADASSASSGGVDATGAGRRQGALRSVCGGPQSSGSHKPSILAKSVQDKGLVAFASDAGMARDASDLVDDILAGHAALEDLNGEFTDGEEEDEDADAHSQPPEDEEGSAAAAERVSLPGAAGGEEDNMGDGAESWATASNSDDDDDDDDDSDFVP